MQYIIFSILSKSRANNFCKFLDYWHCDIVGGGVWNHRPQELRSVSRCDPPVRGFDGGGHRHGARLQLRLRHQSSQRFRAALLHGDSWLDV